MRPMHCMVLLLNFYCNMNRMFPAWRSICSSKPRLNCVSTRKTEWFHIRVCVCVCVCVSVCVSSNRCVSESSFLPLK